MNRNLLIVGANEYGTAVKEVAKDMSSFDKIDFVDDENQYTQNDVNIVGKISDIVKLSAEYRYIFVAIENPDVRIPLLKKIEQETTFIIATIISPKANVSPTAHVMRGSFVGPLSFVDKDCVISYGCIISAGAVINESSVCCEGVYAECNSAVKAYAVVPAGYRVSQGKIYDKNSFDTKDFFIGCGSV